MFEREAARCTRALDGAEFVGGKDAVSFGGQLLRNAVLDRLRFVGEQHDRRVLVDWPHHHCVGVERDLYISPNLGWPERRICARGRGYDEVGGVLRSRGNRGRHTRWRLGACEQQACHHDELNPGHRARFYASASPCAVWLSVPLLWLGEARAGSLHTRMPPLAPHHRHSFQDYLDIEQMSAVRHEFFEGEIYAMAGGTPEHAALAGALLVLLGGQLRGGPCRMYPSDLRIRIRESGLATYPDAAAICGAVEKDPDSPTHVTNPIAVFEVLSPSTELYDRGEKRAHYQKLPSLQLYVLVAQSHRTLEVWRRRGQQWEHEVFVSGQTVTLAAIGGTLDVDTLYVEAGL